MPAILIVAEYGSLNGGERSLLSIIPHLQNRGCRFSALLPAPSAFAESLHALNVSVHPFRFRDQQGARKPLEELRAQLDAAIRTINADLVHLNSLSASRVAATLTSELDLPLIGHFRDMLKLSRRAIDDLNQLNQIIAVSHATRNWHIAQGIQPDLIRVIYNGVDAAAFAPRPPSGWLHRELGIAAQTKILLSVGQIGMRKGLDVTLAAAEQLLRRRGDLHFVFVGERHSAKTESVDYQRRLLARSALPHLRPHVHWLGERQDVDAIMQESHLLVHAARQEPLGRVLLESFASGLPAVATDVGGTREVFCDDALTDLLVPADNANLLAECLSRLIDSPCMISQISRRIRQLAVEKFSAAGSAAAVHRAYQDALS